MAGVNELWQVGRGGEKPVAAARPTRVREETLRQPQSRNQGSISGQTLRYSPSAGIVRAPQPDALRGGRPDGNGFGGGFAPGRLHGHGRALTRPDQPRQQT